MLMSQHTKLLCPFKASKTQLDSEGLSSSIETLAVVSPHTQSEVGPRGPLHRLSMGI